MSCPKPCRTCPFAYTDESEQIQNYGCLPTRQDIIEMKVKTGNNWACHGNEKKMCGGLQEWNNETPTPWQISKGDPRPLDLSKGTLIVEPGVHYSVDPKTGERVK